VRLSCRLRGGRSVLLGDLNEVAAGVLENRRGNWPHGDRRLAKDHTEAEQPRVRPPPRRTCTGCRPAMRAALNGFTAGCESGPSRSCTPSGSWARPASTSGDAVASCNNRVA
jgi:hypothetical protein